MESCELTILMPCLNEAETLASCIQKAKKFLASENIHGEILIADNGSSDGSQAIAKREGARLITVTAPGYGAALKGGIAAAKGCYIIMGDADDSYDFQNLKPFLCKLREGYDLVMGNRFKGCILKKAMPWLNRYIGNPLLSFLGRCFFKSPIGDFHCGLRGFRRESLQQLSLHGDGMEFASEMIVKATLKNLKLAEVPITLFPDGRSRRPHLRPWRDGWRHLRLLLLYSPRWLFLYPGLFLLLSGLLFMLFPTRLMMLLGSVFSLIGFQAVSFSVFSQTMTGPSLLKCITLERGLIAGSILILFSLSCAFLRAIIPAITFFVLGLQLIFASFFMSMLRLQYENNRAKP